MTIIDIDSWLDGVTPLYGAHYLAEYWTDHNTNEWPIDWSRRPLASVFDEGFEQLGRRCASFDYVLERSRGAPRAPIYPGDHPFDVLRIPTLHGVGWLDNITPPHMLDYEVLMRNPETAPFQYLHAGSTDHENYQIEKAPIPERDDHATHDDALAEMLPRYLGPALDFFDAFLSGRTDPAAVPRVRWHLPREGWRESASWPPPGAHELRLYLDEPEQAGGAPPGGRLRREPGEAGEAAWTHDPEDPVPSTLVDPFSAVFEYPDEREVEGRPDVMVFTTPAWDEPVTLAGRVVAHLRVAGDGPSMYLHVKLVDVAAGRSGAHAALRPAGGRAAGRRDDRGGVPRAHRPPGRARAAAAPARRDQRLPGVPAAPGDGREPVGRDRDPHQPPDAGDRR